MKIDNVGQLPDDYLKMPPPYWRSSGMVFHIISSLEDLCGLLKELVPLNAKTDTLLQDYFSRNPEPNDDDPKFGEICNDLWELEHKISLKAEVSMLMSAIAAEDRLNMFCVYNLDKDIVEPLERLSPPEKLQMASAILGHRGIKSKRPYSALKRLTTWRNAFAHGHCVDRPTKTLRHNHLIKPSEFPTVPKFIADLIDIADGYIQIYRYLASISVNPYTAGTSVELKEIEQCLDRISKYCFEGSNSAYEIRFVG